MCGQLVLVENETSNVETQASVDRVRSLVIRHIRYAPIYSTILYR
jgi:hypothetical protein